MPKPFIALTLDQFRALLGTFPFTRQVNAVHMHHTFRPTHAQFRGLASIDAMYAFHTRERHFSDIAQHITIAPDGMIFTGRSWNQAPASATGHNGNSAFGPFMFETVGDFDTGNDPFEDPQRETVLQVIAAVQRRFGLPPDALRFHREMAPKSCPGTGIDRATIVQAVAERHAAPAASRGVQDDAPFDASFRDDGLSATDRAVVASARKALERVTPVDVAHEAELPESSEPAAGPDAREGAQRTVAASETARGGEIPVGELIALRPHLIDLNEGKLTRGGEIFTLPEDVQRIFAEDIEKAFADPLSMGMPARAEGEPFRIMFWAHGGLIGEKDGIGIAAKHVEFWKANGIYPVYFVWETGLLETVGHLLRGMLPGARETRNLFSDRISDPLIERAARAAGGPKIWAGMKRDAELAAATGGGLLVVAKELKKFCKRHPGAFELHAAGHSAGSIFHAHFLPLVLSSRGPSITSLHLLAPAMTVDLFKETLLTPVGGAIGSLSLFTMFKEQELRDNCAGIYRKSLLYLVRAAMEPERDAEILGLEECLRRDRDVATLFGLAGAPPGAAEVIFSPSVAADGASATRSTTHGGFDDDPPTMNSVALRVLGQTATSSLNRPYPVSRALPADPWVVPEVLELQRSFASAVVPMAPSVASASSPCPPSTTASSAPVTSVSAEAQPSAPAIHIPGSGARRALCVGIDTYPVRPLAGCVADARQWARTLGALGFDCATLLDDQATYAEIKARLEQLIASARAGDVIVWQYAGHGTQVPDVDGDEATGDSPGLDEAICPIDFQTGHLLIDDEIGGLIRELPPGVDFTMFIDSCHSGTLNRFGFGEPPPGSEIRDERARFLPLSDEVRAAYLEVARARRDARDLPRSRTRGEIQATSEVLFTACLSTEVAWESDGHGEFTLRATAALADHGLGFTNETFIQAVTAAFGPNPRQTPTLTCATGLRTAGLLQAAGHA